MGYEEEVHKLLKSRRGEFLRFGQIKASLGLRDVQLSKALRRLEDDGLIVRHSVEYNRKPVNTYLGIDPNDYGFKVTVYIDGNWMFCWFEWKYEDGSSKATSMNLGEMADYYPMLIPIDVDPGKVGPTWLPWMDVLIEARKLDFQDTSSPTRIYGFRRDL